MKHMFNRVMLRLILIVCLDTSSKSSYQIWWYYSRQFSLTFSIEIGLLQKNQNQINTLMLKIIPALLFLVMKLWLEV